MTDLVRISRYISMLLRHKPEEAGLVIDQHGYVKTTELIKSVKNKFPEFNRDMLVTIVDTDDKQRYSFKDHKKYIRANQGHSIKVDLELVAVPPPSLLFHGTSEKYLDSIIQEGIVPKSRQYVHLSKDVDTAYSVGIRHGSKTIILVVNAEQMHNDGYEFFISDNGVWLTDAVPTGYFTVYKMNSRFDLNLLKIIVGEYNDNNQESKHSEQTRNDRSRL